MRILRLLNTRRNALRHQLFMPRNAGGGLVNVGNQMPIGIKKLRIYARKRAHRPGSCKCNRPYCYWSQQHPCRLQTIGSTSRPDIITPA